MIDRRLAATLAAWLLACALPHAAGAATGPTRIVDLRTVSPGSGNGVVFLDAMRQASPWMGVDGVPLTGGTLAGIKPGETAERIVYANEDYPAGDYTLTWSGSATFSVAGGSLSPAPMPNSLVVRVHANDGSGLRIRVTAGHGAPVRDVHLYLPGARAAALRQIFAPAFVQSLAGADVLRFAAWEATEPSPDVTTASTGARGAVAPNSVLAPRVVRPWQGTGQHAAPVAAYSGSGGTLAEAIQLANMTGANPWISIRADATDTEIYGKARHTLRTLDPSLRPVLEYASRDMMLPATPSNAWALKAVRVAHLNGDPQTAVRTWYARRYARVLAVFRQVFGAQAWRIVPADSPEVLQLHHGTPNANASVGAAPAQSTNRYSPGITQSNRSTAPAVRMRTPMNARLQHAVVPIPH